MNTRSLPAGTHLLILSLLVLIASCGQEEPSGPESEPDTPFVELTIAGSVDTPDFTGDVKLNG